MIAWSDTFRRRFESEWGVAQKLAWLNGQTVSDMRRLLLSDEHPNGICEAPNSRSQARAALLGGPELKGMRDGLKPQLSDTLRFCMTCIHDGYHGLVHELHGLQRCPFHGLDLIDRCVECRMSLGSTLRRRGTPFACQHCSHVYLERHGDDVSPSWLLQREPLLEESFLRWLLHGRESVALPWRQHLSFRTDHVGGASRVSTQQLWPAIVERTMPAPCYPQCFIPLPERLRVVPVPLWSERKYDCEIDRASACEIIDSVRDELATGDLAGHMDCYRSSAYLMLSGRTDEAPLHYEPALCLQAAALTLWECRVKAECDLIGTPHKRRAPGKDRWRASLVGSFRYCLESMELLHTAFMAQDYDAIEEILNAGALDVHRDPWMSRGAHVDDDTFYTGAYHTVTLAADDGDHFCDHLKVYDEHLARVREAGKLRFASIEKNLEPRQAMHRAKRH